MGKIRLVLAAAIVAVSAMGAAAPATAEPAPTGKSRDKAFTKAIADEGLDIEADQAIDLARSTCAVLKETGSAQEGLLHIKNTTSWTSNDDITTFGIAAVQTYCPKLMPKA